MPWTSSTTPEAVSPKETNWWGAFVIGLAGHDPRHRDRACDGHPARRGGHPAASSRHDHRLAALPVPGRASAMMPERTGGAPAYAYPAYKDRWPRRRQAHQRHHGVDVLARLVPGRAAEHDPGVVLPGRPLRPEHDVGLHADQHVHRLVDARHRGRRDPAVLHPRLPRHPVRHRLRHRAGDHLDGPADVPGGRVPLHRRRRLGPALGLPPARRHRLLHEPRRPRLVPALHGLRVPADVERDRDGGGRLLHRRDARPRDATRRSR